MYLSNIRLKHHYSIINWGIREKDTMIWLICEIANIQLTVKDPHVKHIT